MRVRVIGLYGVSGVNRVRAASALASGRAARRVVVMALGALLVAPLGACGKRAGGSRAQAAPPVRTTVRIENRNFLDMTIYVVRPMRVRLGFAPGVTTTTFVIPSSVVGQGVHMRFLADPVGRGATPVSEEIYVAAGDEVTLAIPPN